MAKIKGLCKNVEECSKAKNKELQARSKTDLFVCEECYEPLDKIIEKADNSKKYYMIGGGVLILILLITIGCILMKDNSVPKETSITSDLVEAKALKEESPNTEQAPIEEEIVQEDENPTQDEVYSEEKAIEADAKTEAEAAENIDNNDLIEKEKAKTSTHKRTAKNVEATNIITYDDEIYDLGYATWSGKLNNSKPHGNAQMTFKRRHLIEPRDDKSRYAKAGDYIIGTYKNGHLIHGRWYKKNGNIETITIGEAASNEE